MGNPRRANGHRRDQVRAKVLREESDCWLCGEPVDKTLPPYLHGSPEVDEVIPVSLGGDPLDRKNCRLSHRICNVRRGNGTRRVKSGARRVVLVCGPAGSGKSTLAHTLGLDVYDVDDPKWEQSEKRFRDALRAVACDGSAQAVVIRSAATLSARTKAAQICGATEVHVIETDLATCIERIKQRGRMAPPIRTQIAAARDWWMKYQPGDVVTSAPHTTPPLKRVREW